MDLDSIMEHGNSGSVPARHWLAIINPAAGFHCTPGWLPRLKNRLQNELGAGIFVTHDSDHISEILSSSTTATDLAVFGGDGTIAEVVNRMRLNQQRLLPLPGGTGNGLVRDLGLTSIDLALAAVRAKAYRPIDVLHVTFRAQGERIQRLAVSTSALGYSAEVVISASRLPRPLGLFRYALASILSTLRMSAYSVTLQLDNQPLQERQLTNIMVNNTRHAASFLIFQKARPSDGEMNVLLSGNRFWGQTLENLAILAHNHTARFHKDHYSVKRLRLNSSPAMGLMLDGEMWDGVDEVSFVVLMKKLRCYYQ